MKKAMETKIRIFQEMKCWMKIDIKTRKYATFETCVSQEKKWNEKPQKYEASLVVRGIEEKKLAKEFLSPVADFMVIKSVLRLTIQRGLHKRLIDFENAFPNENLNRSVYNASPRYVQSGDEVKNKVPRLQRSLYRLKDSAKIWFDTEPHQYKVTILKELKTVSCVYYKNGMIVDCYVKDLLVFTESRRTPTDLESIFKRNSA